MRVFFVLEYFFSCQYFQTTRTDTVESKMKKKNDWCAFKITKNHLKHYTRLFFELFALLWVDVFFSFFGLVDWSPRARFSCIRCVSCDARDFADQILIYFSFSFHISDFSLNFSFVLFNTPKFSRSLFKFFPEKHETEPNEKIIILFFSLHKTIHAEPNKKNACNFVVCMFLLFCRKLFGAILNLNVFFYKYSTINRRMKRKKLE